eukprot:jgi/Tetstr1/448475/TSEL_035743.t1
MPEKGVPSGSSSSVTATSRFARPDPPGRSDDPPETVTAKSIRTGPDGLSTTEVNLSYRIGRGAFATVHLGETSCSERVSVAVKAIRCSSAADAAAARRELKLGKLLASRPACRFPAVLGSDFTVKPGRNAHVYITYELLRGGTLEQLLHSRRRLSEADARQVTFELFSALAATHAERVVHSDIKPGNVMFATPGDLKSLRIIDLGLATDLSLASRSVDVGGTRDYFSPEQVRTWYSGKPGFGLPTDVWSAGVVAYEMLCGSPPFSARKASKLLHQICLTEPGFSGPSWEGVSSQAKDFVRKAMVKDPSRRMTAKAALRHPWLREVGSDASHAGGWLAKLTRLGAHKC